MKVNRSLIAIGVTSNYLERKSVRESLRRYAKAGYSLSFFHPLRVTAIELRLSNVVNERTLFEDLIEAVGEVSLRRDANNFIKRLRLFKSEVLSTHFGGLIRVVLHTEYSIPFWCSEVFTRLYLGIIPMLVSEINEELERYTYEVVVEVHPGFTSFDDCSVNIRKGKGNVVLSCKNQYGVGRDFKKLVECLSKFKREILCKLAGTRTSVCIEPRAGSSVYVGKRSLYQTLENHYMTVLFAKEVDTGVVLDPGQSSVKKIMGEDGVWRELYNISNQYPNLVDEIHVHSPLARKGRGHGLPSPQELEGFVKLIRSLLKHRTKPLGVIYEVIAIGRSESLVQNLDQLLSMIEEV